MRFLHLMAYIDRPPRKEGLSRRASSRESVIAYTIEGSKIKAGISFKHPHDSFRRKLGSAAARENYETQQFVFYLPYEKVPLDMLSNIIIDILSDHHKKIIPNLPYDDTTNIFFMKRT